jgi:hypothetical protein
MEPIASLTKFRKGIDHRTYRFVDTVPVEKSGQFLRISSIISFSDERGNSQTRDKDNVHLFTTGEELRTDVQVGVYNASRVE